MLDVSTPPMGERRATFTGAAFLEAVIATTPECIKVVAFDGELLQMNAAGLAMVGAAGAADVVGGDMLSLVAPEHREEWRRNHERVCLGERLIWAFDIIGLGGRRRHMESHATPITLPGGQPAQLSITRDVGDREDADARQRLLIDELNHRVKNTLSTVQSIAAQTLRGQPSLPGFRNAFEARLMALSRAHDLLTRTHWAGASLADVVTAGVDPGIGHRFSAQGPLVWLEPRAVLTLGMVFHELMANAASHGALSAPGGRVDLSWVLVEEPGRADVVLTLAWAESGGPAVTAPRILGFGGRLIQQGAARDLRGAASLDFRPDGLRCRLDLPLPVATT